MERLTEKHFNGNGYYMVCSGNCANDDEMCGGCPENEKIIDRLGAYEDTGMNPEQIPMWIPVTERLPEIPDGWAENPEPVLYMMKNTKTIYAGYYGEGGVWRDKYFRQYADSRNGVDADDVLCWMWQHDLPELPKGE